ncbi:hypothetical protein I3843_03G045700 [Carya illinoinensis]|uniref:Hydroxyproline O-arabinosyltransferase-like domain-containing protein n=1 Tax=Carya illinoinensis TaxID=32201 RepID=A0A922FCG4_CARIL|nr:hypothetical protein I3760_03G042600 [Carya illinoinensis]KAG6720139.1 hypothetical protein I3842_03G044500 [Carya illinoinensis]KAG7985787.1 hypothetical protein I3843_03G045700 [Carya illinoinensis]
MAKLLILVLVVVGLMGPGWSAETGREAPWRIHTLFSVECQNYFDWQTVGLMHSFRKARQPGPITRLLSCTEEEKKNYRGMGLAPTVEVPSMSRHPRTGDWYPAINKPAGVVHWLKHSKDADNVDWVVILDADMIIRGPIIPWELGAEKGKPVAAYYGYLIGCDNALAKLHTKHPELCDKVGGLLAMHIDDLRALAPLWLSKTEEVREDRAHWSTNLTGDIYGKGWISEMYGYSFGAAEVGLQHKINDNLMIYPGYIPREGVEPILLHYGLPFSVGNWSFSKLDHHEDDVVYDCDRLFPEPPFPREVHLMESDPNKRRALFLSIECIHTLNEGLLLQHKANGCPKPTGSKYLSFLRSKTFAELTRPKLLTPATIQTEKESIQTVPKQFIAEPGGQYPKIHTIFSTECIKYFDWQTVGLVHSFHLSGQPGNITRLLSCSDEDLKQYTGHDLAPTHYVPSMSKHPLTGDWYPAINKPAAVLHWLNHANIDAEFIVILDADMILRDPPDPSTLDHTDEDMLQRDLLSIECIKTLNEALRLHHERRNCPDPSTLSTSKPNAAKEIAMSRKFGSFDEINAVRSNHLPNNNSDGLSKPAVIDRMFSSFRFWLVALWAFAGFGFLAVMFVVFSSRKKRTRGKNYRHKRRSSYT